MKLYETGGGVDITGMQAHHSGEEQEAFRTGPWSICHDCHINLSKTVVDAVLIVFTR
jgi:hypothetical protein